MSTARSVPASAWLWLLAGTGLLVLAQHGHPDIAVAGWVFAIFLLRFSRAAGVGPGFVLILVGHLLAGAAWVIGIRLPGDGVPWGAIAGVAVLNAVFAVPFLIDRLLAVRLQRAHPLLASLAFPLAHVGAELLVLTVSPFGKVFGSLAASQHGNLPLLQLAAVTGAYGIGFLMCWFAAAVCEVWQHPRRLLPVGVVAAVLAVVLAGGSVALNQSNSAETVKIAGITPARSLAETSAEVPPVAEAAEDPEAVRQIMAPVTEDLLGSTRQQAAAGAHIITWSEAATWVHEDDLDAVIGQVGSIAAQYDIRVQLAVAVITERPPHGRNIAVLVGPDGTQQWLYDKVHPVMGLESIVPGTEPPPVLETEYGRLAAMICYDLDYADTARTDADIVLLPSADWPGFDRLHTEKAKVTAVEQGYAVVRQDAHGTAATFDARGRTLAAVDYYGTDRQVMITEVPIHGVRTPYATVGDLFGYGCVAALAGLAMFAAINPRRTLPVR